MWEHRDRSCHATRNLTIVNVQLVVADMSNKIFTIYTRKGERVRKVQCDLLTDRGFTTLCHARNESLIVSRTTPNPELFKVNLQTVDVQWRSNRVEKPIGVTTLNKDYAVVISHEENRCTKFFVINSFTGQYV